MRSLLVFLSVLIPLTIKALPPEGSEVSRDSLLRSFLKEAIASDRAEVDLVVTDSADTVAIPHSRPKRGVAIALTVLLGPLGGHRLYLGTEPRVPVLYTITLGGGLGLLPLIDLVQLIVVRDMDDLLNNRKVFMWLKEDDPEEEKE
jgi:hypothetical protein